MRQLLEGKCNNEKSILNPDIKVRKISMIDPCGGNASTLLSTGLFVEGDNIPVLKTLLYWFIDGQAQKTTAANF